MCSLSFVPLADGYVVAMNRDEQRSRKVACFPAVRRQQGMDAIYPTEPDTGGTWLGVNEQGVTYALLNWYAKPLKSNAPSRGLWIPRRLHSAQQDIVLAETEALMPFNPFRLFRFLPGLRSVEELRWDGVQVEVCQHGWTQGHWFSSGYREQEVCAMRAATVATTVAPVHNWQESIPWLRRLHSGHDPVRGAESICMHRQDAQTVSFSEIQFRSGAVTFRYYDGSPCQLSCEQEMQTWCLQQLPS